MLNLEEKITGWRKEMLDAGVGSPVSLEELESHLREDIERQMKAGVGETEAFRLAAERIGQARAVRREFEKAGVGPGLEKWKEILVLACSILLPIGIGAQIVSGRGAAAGMSAAEKGSSLAALALFSVLIWGGRMGYRLFPVIPLKRTRFALVYSCGALMVAWWTLFLWVIAVDRDFTSAQFTVNFIRAFIVPGGAWLGFALGMENAARRRKVA